MPPNTQTILLLIRDELGGIPVFIVGNELDASIRSLASDDVIVTGRVPTLALSPLRFGAGIKTKIAESMSYGLPVVSSQIGAEGFEAHDGEEMLIAEDEAAFASKVVRL